MHRAYVFYYGNESPQLRLRGDNAFRYGKKILCGNGESVPLYIQGTLSMILKRGVTGFTADDLSLERDWVAHTVEFKKY